MNIVNTLTLRHLKQQKKRSILTVLAIIVSVAMVTAVFTSVQTFIMYFRNVASAIDGSWHTSVYADNLPGSLSQLDSDKIDKYGIVFYYGSLATIPATEDDDETVYDFDIEAVDKNFLELRNVVVTEGRMPENTNEILLNRKSVEKRDIDVKIGDKFCYEMYSPNTEEKQMYDFTVVGFTDSRVSETDMTAGFVLATDDYISSVGSGMVYIRFAKLNMSVLNETSALAQNMSGDPGNFCTNTMLLTYSGVSNDDTTINALIGFASIILVIIAVVSIFMIYDSFAISYREREKYLGMLASVGATKKQKRASIYFEGFILGLIGIPLGIIFGIGGISITFGAISDVWVKTLAVEYDGALKTSVNVWVILATIAASALTIFISSYIPARKASKTSPVDAIRQAGSVVVKKPKKLKTSPLVVKLLGYEGALAVKNYKRNAKRSRTIVISLFMSVVVFVTVADFSLMVTDLMSVKYSFNPDLAVHVNGYKDAQDICELVKNIDRIDRSFVVGSDYAFIGTDYNDENSPDYTNDMVNLVFTDNATLDAYLNQLGENTAKYHDLTAPTAILQNVAYKKEGNKELRINPLINIAGKSIDIKIPVSEDSDEEIKLSAVIGIQTTSVFNDDAFNYQKGACPSIFMSLDFAPVFFGDYDNYTLHSTADIFCKDPEKVENDLTQKVLSDYNMKYYSVYSEKAEMEAINNLLIIARVFVVGFITLITLISIMNIINTISTSMNERRREFAMIRSVGMTPKSFKKMIYYESFRYGIKSLLFSIPVSVGIHYIMYKVLAEKFDYGFTPYPLVIVIAAVAVLAIISLAILYSSGKIRKDNIIDTLKLDIT